MKWLILFINAEHSMNNDHSDFFHSLFLFFFFSCVSNDVMSAISKINERLVVVHALIQMGTL